MKYSIYFLFLTFIIFQSCSEDELMNSSVPTCEQCNFNCLDRNDTDIVTNDCLDNWTCIFQVSAESKVDLNEAEGKAVGNNRVFQMMNRTEGSPMISDDEFENILVFELAENQNSFAVEAADLADMNVHFRRLCFCADTEFQAVTAGCLQGEKQADGTWFVQGNLVIPYSWGDFEVKLEASFTN
jgi:hypothetical protein